MTYEKNPNYHRADEVKIEKQEFMLSSDETATFAAYNAGDLDFSDGVPPLRSPACRATRVPCTSDGTGTYYVSFNVNSPMFEGMSAEDAATLRKALALFVDRDYIVTNVGQADQVPAGSFIPLAAWTAPARNSRTRTTSILPPRPLRPTWRKASP